MTSKKETKSFAYRLISFMFILLVIVFTISIAATRLLVGGVMVSNARDTISSLANEKLLLIDNKLNKLMSLGKSYRNLRELDMLTEAEDRIHIEQMLRDNTEVRSICIAFQPDLGMNSTIWFLESDSLKVKVLTGSDYQFKDWFHIPLLTGREYWSDPWFDADGVRQMISSYSLPLHQGEEIIGMLRLDAALGRLQEVVLPLRIKESGITFLISNNGTIVSHPADSLILNYTIFDLADEYKDLQLRNLGKRMLLGETGFERMLGHSYFQDKWLYFAPMQSNQWVLAIAIDSSEVFADLNSLLLINFLTLLVVFLMICIIIYARTHILSKPLKQLASAAGQIGSGDFDTPIQVSTNIFEIQSLSDSLSLMQSSLREYIENLKQITAEKNQIFNEVMFASTIQKNLIPSNLQLASPVPEIQAYGILEPAGEIGGDLYDYFLIDDHHFCFVIADVLGKGIVAAMTMTMVTTFIRSIAGFRGDSTQIMTELNRFLVKNNLESNFVTIVLGILDLRDGKLCFSNCGHVPVYLRKAGREVVKYGQTHSTALGVFEQIEIGQECLFLNPQDEIILFTDGITEAMSSKEVFFGTERLEEIIKKLYQPNPETTAKAILSGVRLFSDPDKYKDDITILVFKFLHPRRSASNGPDTN